MKRARWPWWGVIVVALVVWLGRIGFSFSQSRSDVGEPFRTLILEVVDGDTVRVPGYTVRLYGVDAPEKDQPFGSQATGCLAALVWGRVVEVHPRDTDRYGRLVAVLVVDGQDVNATLVAQGCAWAYPKTGQDYRDEELRARLQGLGLWALPNPIPPWEWRK